MCCRNPGRWASCCLNRDICLTQTATGIRISCSSLRTPTLPPGARISAALRYFPRGAIRSRSRHSSFLWQNGPTEPPRSWRCVRDASSASAERASSCGLFSGESCFQLVERARPSFLMGAARLVVTQKRMGESNLGALGNGPERDLDPRLVRVFLAAFPTPTHHHPFGPYDLEIFAA